MGVVFSLVYTKAPQYHDKVGTISCLGPVMALAMSQCGYIGIGTKDSLVIRTPTLARVTTPVFQAFHGPVLAIGWAPVTEGAEHVAFATMWGYLHVWSNPDGPLLFRHVAMLRLTPSPPTSLTFRLESEDRMKILAGANNRDVSMIVYLTEGTLTETSRVECFTGKPRGLAFQATDRVHVAGHDGQLLDIEMLDQVGDQAPASKVLKETALSPCIGVADIRGATIVVDNMVNGASLFKITDGEVVHTYEVPRHCDTNPDIQFQVQFAGDGKLILMGSDHGLVYVFDTHKRILIEKLRHSHSGRVCYVAANRVGPKVTIAAALLKAAKDGGQYDVVVWKTKSDSMPVRAKQEWRKLSWSRIMWYAVQVIVWTWAILAVVLYTAQIIRVRQYALQTQYYKKLEQYGAYVNTVVNMQAFLNKNGELPDILPETIFL